MRVAPRTLAALTAVMLGAGIVVLLILPGNPGVGVPPLVFGAIFPLIWLIIPRRYEVWPDSVRLVFPLWRWRIQFDSIERIETAKLWQPYGFWGIRFATNPAQAVTIYRKEARILGRPNLVISPERRDEFLEHLPAAILR
ncbi:MAG TPA: hypothetical protein VFY10_09475 [Dehalococcoidia bacterium]|nr:hypothetical protein [Dehalococcoidia bacterium]